MLNLPIDLSQYKKILFLGIGGGFDIYGALPLCNHTSKTVFANVNIKATEMYQANYEGSTPEHRLAKWLINENIYVLPKCGVKQLVHYLETIHKKEEFDFIMCVDGGIDSLMTGDEEGTGTFLEDTVSLLAVSKINIPSALMCIGFGTEMEEELCHYLALENMAILNKDGAFLGSCCLTKHGPEYGFYKEACEHGWKNARKSHIHTKIISAVEGKFGEENLYEDIDPQVVGASSVKNFTNPLMNIMWFYDIRKVLGRNKIAEAITNTNTKTDVFMIYRNMFSQIANKRKRKSIPL